MYPAEYLRTRQAAEFLRAQFGFGAISTLNKLRCVGGGPPFHRIGVRLVAYDKQELADWAASKIGPPLKSTSEVAATKRQPTCNSVEAV